MKKSIKSILAKATAIALVFSLVGITPSTSSDAASKKPTVTKKVTVKVGKTKKVKVTSKKKVKKTKWTLTKAGKKVVKLSKKKKKSVKVKGLKAGKATLTAKIKVGKKTYKKKCKITVKVASSSTDSTATATPAGSSTDSGSSTSATATPSSSSDTNNYGGVTPDSTLTVDGTTYTVDEDSSYFLDITELNETTFTCNAKRPDDSPFHSDIVYNRDGSVTFSSDGDYNYGVSYYINPCTSEDDLVELTSTRGEGYYGYQNATKDVSEYDYVRITVTSENEMNCRTYNGYDALESQGFPGSATSETYEGGWVGPTDDYWDTSVSKSAGNAVQSEYYTRTLFIPISSLYDKGMNPATLTAIAFCPQAGGEEVTIHNISFVKLADSTAVTGIEVTSTVDTVANGKTTTLTADVTPSDATHQIVKWESSDESLATISYKGIVVAADDGSGDVTFTATATDGSGVTGSITLAIGGSTATTTVTTQSVDLTDSANISIVQNDGTANTCAFVSDGIMFNANATMTAVDFSAYLTANSIDLSDYDSVIVSYKFVDANGDTLADCPLAANQYGTYLKVALAPSASLNGYSDGVASGYGSTTDVSSSKELDISALDAATVATIAGFNFQASALDTATYEDVYTVITDITFYKDNNHYVDLSDSANISIIQNDGTAGTCAFVSDGIMFNANATMTAVDFSAYLTANDIDLADYSSITVSYKFVDANGDTLADCPLAANQYGTYLKVALAPSASLNGYSDGVASGYGSTTDVSSSKELDISGLDAATVATIAGFNFQASALDTATYEDVYTVITGITFNCD